MLKHRRVCVAVKSVLGSQDQTGNAIETWGGPIAPVAPTVHALKALRDEQHHPAGGSGLLRAKRRERSIRAGRAWGRGAKRTLPKAER